MNNGVQALKSACVAKVSGATETLRAWSKMCTAFVATSDSGARIAEGNVGYDLNFFVTNSAAAQGNIKDNIKGFPDEIAKGGATMKDATLNFAL